MPRRLKDEESEQMPKLKTHRGAAKRFKKTGTGKFTGLRLSSATS